MGTPMKMAADMAVAPVETAAALARKPMATVAPKPVTMVASAPVAAAALGGAPVAAATSAHVETVPVEKAAMVPMEMEVEVPVDEADNSGAEGRAYCLETTPPPHSAPCPPWHHCHRRLVHLWKAPVHQRTASAQFENGHGHLPLFRGPSFLCPHGHHQYSCSYSLNPNEMVGVGLHT